MRIAPLLPALLLAASHASAREPAPLKRSEINSLSEDALVRRIFGPLAADLFVTRFADRSARPRQPVSIWFWTRPRKDWLRDGLCVSDRMMVHLAPVPLSLGDDPPLRLRRIETDSNYIIRDRKLAARMSGIDPKEREGQDEACALLDPRRDSTPAESGWQLMKALEVTEALGRAARAGRAPVPIDCKHLRFGGPPPEDETECLKALSVLGEHSVHAVQDCADSQVTGGYCLRVQTSDWFIYFVLGWASQDMERVIVQGMEDLSQAHF